MRAGLNRREVESLAKTMEVKFSISGPAIGGAKSGIDFDPSDSRKNEVLNRWYKAVMPLLKTYYGTGGDLNIDEVNEVIPITEKYGLWHPQEGVVTGHFEPSGAELVQKVGQLRSGVKKIVENNRFTPCAQHKFTIADLITGWGVAESVRHYYDLYGGAIKHKRVIVQGWGNVGAAAAYYLSQLGASIVGIIDRSGGLMSKDGFSKEDVRALYLSRQGNQLVHPNLMSSQEIHSHVWSLGADVFLPCAASRLVTHDHMSTLVDSGLELVACGANVPFADQEIFYGPTCEWADKNVALIPDFIANCGMARAFAFLMSQPAKITDELIFDDVSHTIRDALAQCHKLSKMPREITSKALEIALNKLMR